jgi:tRNA(Arg) A34 adenosine deaminase TadA
MCRHQKFIQIAAEQAKKSNLTFHLGACLVSAGKINSRGYNMKRNKFSNIIYSSLHAEISAIRNCKNIRRIIRQNYYDLYIARILNEKENAYGNAKPCKMCLDYLKFFKIRRIIYTTGNCYEYAIEKLNIIDSNYISSAAKQYPKQKNNIFNC